MLAPPTFHKSVGRVPFLSHISSRSFVFSLCVSFNPRPLQPPTCVLSTKPAALPRPWGSPVEASLWCQGGAEAGKLENRRHLHLKGSSHPRGPPVMCWHMLRAAGRGMGNVMDCLGIEGKTLQRGCQCRGVSESGRGMFPLQALKKGWSDQAVEK